MASIRNAVKEWPPSGMQWNGMRSMPPFGMRSVLESSCQLLWPTIPFCPSNAQDRLAELDEVPGLRARVEALEQVRARLQAEVVDKDAAAAAAAHLMSVSQPHPVAGPISGWDAGYGGSLFLG